MHRSTERILTTHAGSLPRPQDLVAETFLPAAAPGTIEHWMRNRYYLNEEAYL
jgi:hypothetical protein